MVTVSARESGPLMAKMSEILSAKALAAWWGHTSHLAVTVSAPMSEESSELTWEIVSVPLLEPLWVVPLALLRELTWVIVSVMAWALP
jgi:hypothetical protein